jgi:O-antigen/teichoic acid export membrane protein
VTGRFAPVIPDVSTDPNAATPPPAAAGTESLRKRVISASLWAVGSGATGQVIRLASNLLLTRMLIPEHFGLMAIVNSLRVGTEMLSDIGVGPLVISDRSDDPRFLNTLWSVKAVRGLLLAVIVAGLAYPAALWFKDDRLLGLVPLAGISLASRGFGHLCEYTLTRDLRQRPAFVLELVSQLVGVSVNLALVYIYRSVWALAVGGLVSDVFRTGLTHYLGRDRPHRFAWDPAVIRQLRNFGRWVLMSSTLTYVVHQGDRLILGSMLTMAQLGNYAVAVTLAGALDSLVGQLTKSVFFPVYSMVGKSTTDQLRARIKRLRYLLSLATIPPLSCVVVFGDVIVKLLWDARYADASWMVRILAAGYLVQTFGKVGPIHLARGESWVGMVFESVRVVTLIVGLYVGYHVGGAHGVIAGLALVLAAEYPVTIWSTHRYGVWLYQVDLMAALGATLLLALGEFVRHLLGWGW